MDLSRKSPHVELAPEDIAEHDYRFHVASRILMRHAILDGRLFDRRRFVVNWFSKWRVRTAIAHLQKVVAINSANWAAEWFLGKAYQRLAENQLALEHFERANELEPAQVDVLRELSIAAAECGDRVKAIRLTQRALELSPGDHGLRANLAMFYLFDGRAAEARDEAHKALSGNPKDRITKRLVKVVDEVAAGRRPCPRCSAEIMK